MYRVGKRGIPIMINHEETWIDTQVKTFSPDETIILAEEDKLRFVKD